MNILEKLDNHLNEMRDEDNPKFMFQTFNTKLLMKIAKGMLDTQKIAQKTLADEGIGKKGKWVGFDQAAKEWGFFNKGYK